MEEPWFRRDLMIGYVPIRWQGWAVVLAMVTLFVPFGVMFVLLADSNPVTGWLCGAVAAIVGIIGHAVVVWKLERRYDR